MLWLPGKVCPETASMAGYPVKITWFAEHPGFKISIQISKINNLASKTYFAEAFY